MPVTSVVFVIAALALSGIPPLSGFWSKDEILQGIWKDGNLATLVITIGAFFLSALYMTRLCWLVFFGKLKPENESAHEAPFVMTGPIVLLGILTLVFGFTAPDWLDNVLGLPGGVTGFANFVSNQEESFHEHVVLAAVSSGVALVGIVLGLALYRQGMSLPGPVERSLAPVRTLAANKYYLDDAYQWTIDRVVLGIGGATAWFDRHVCERRWGRWDGTVHGEDEPDTASAPDGTGLELRSGDHGGHIDICSGYNPGGLRRLTWTATYS